MFAYNKPQFNNKRELLCLYCSSCCTSSDVKTEAGSCLSIYQKKNSIKRLSSCTSTALKSWTSTPPVTWSAHVTSLAVRRHGGGRGLAVLWAWFARVQASLWLENPYRIMGNVVSFHLLNTVIKSKQAEIIKGWRLHKNQAPSITVLAAQNTSVLQGL